MSLVDYFLELEKSKKSDSTVDRRKYDLKAFSHWCGRDIDPENTTVHDIDDFLRWIQNRGFSDSTISSYYYSLKGYYDYLSGNDDSLFEHDLLSHSDYLGDTSGSAEERKKRREKEEMKYVTEEEKEILKENVPSPKIKNELIIELMWQTGIRQSELVLIELDDIDREKREIDIFSPKTDDWRTVYYQPSLDILLDQYINGGYRSRYNSAADSPYLFVSLRGPKMVPHSIGRIIRETAKDSGIQEVTGQDKKGDRHKITSHALRHGHAVYSLKNGIDITFIKTHLGHEDISTTQRYLDLVDTDVRQTYQSKFPA